MKTKNKTAYFEWLRIFASAAVVLMHTAANQWYHVPPESPRWAVLTYWDSLVRWPVPVFLMITGALFLHRKTKWKYILLRYIPRVTAAWIIWSAIHALYLHRTAMTAIHPFETFLNGHYHLWYLPFLCGLYLTLPFLQKIAEDDRLTDQLIAVSFVVGMLVPWLGNAVKVLLPDKASTVSSLLNHIHYTFFFDLLTLPLLGHRLHQRELTAPQRRWIYTAGLLSAAVTGVATVWLSRKYGTCCTLFFENNSPFTLCTAAAVFIFAKHNLTRLPRFVESLAKLSFGVYLSHALVIEILADREIHTMIWNPVWSVPVLAALIFAVCALGTALVRKIPVVGKYLT